MTPTKFNNSSKGLKKNFNKSLFFDTFFTIIIILIMLIIVKNPKRYSEGTISGLKLFFSSVLPGLFPFMLLTKLLTELGIAFKFSNKLSKISQKTFKTPGVSLFAFFMSIMSGYPIGAKIISDLYQKKLISASDAKKMSTFCTTSGPIFIVGSVGTIMFGSYKIGLILYCSHITSSILLGIIYGHLIKSPNPTTPPQIVMETKQKNIISHCINETINGLFVVGAYITIFFLITELLDNIGFMKVLLMGINAILSKLKIETNLTTGTVYGLLEITRGAKILSTSTSKASIILTSGLLSFSGFSIIFQSMAFLKNTQIKTHEFLFQKFMHMLLSMAICYLMLIICF